MKTIAVLFTLSLATAAFASVTAVSLAVAALVPAAASVKADSHSTLQMTQKLYPTQPKSS